MPVTVPVDYETNASGLERDLSRDVSKAGKTAGRGFSDGFKSSVKGLVAGAGIVGGAELIRSQFVGAVKGASDLQESTTKIAAIFGDAQTAVQEFASGGAKALGQSKLEVLDAAATFGTFGKAAGLSGKDLAKFSTGFASLSTDFASFFNSSPEEAVEAIGSALRGEAEPIRKYGILLDDATLRQEALRLGLIKTTKQALTPQQKVLAAQASIYKQSKDAQGDFARTSGGLANQTRILKAQYVDIRSELGTKLLPVVTDVVSATSDLVTEFQNGTGSGGEIRDVLEDVGSVLKDVAEFGKSAFELFDSLPGPVKKIAVEGLAAYLALRKIQGILGPLATGLGATATQGLSAATNVDRVGAAANRAGAGVRNLAGAGGMVLLAKSTSESNEALGIFEGAVGGALTGFAVSGGNPLGAAAGALGGIAINAFKASDGISAAAEAQKRAAGPIQSYSDALGIGKDAINDYVKSLAILNLENTNAFENARTLGISRSTVIEAALGDPQANKIVADKIKESLNEVSAETFEVNGNFANAGQSVEDYRNQLGPTATAASDLRTAIGNNNDELRKNIIKTNEDAIALGKYKEVLGDVPKALVTEIDQIGLEKAEEDIVRLTKKYNLTPKQIETILRASGVDKTSKQIAAIKRQADNAAKDRSFTITAKAGPLLYLRDVLGADLTSKLNSLTGNGPRPKTSNSPKLPSTSAPRPSSGRTVLVSPTDPSAQQSQIVINQINNGPTTSRGKLSEIEWNLTYATRARTGA